MATRLSKDFQPHPQVYKLLSDRFSITIESAREFCGHQLGVFKLHFETRDDAKAVKSNWNTAFYNWMLKSFEDHKEEVARHRDLVPTQGNIFEAALAGKIASDMPEPGKKRIVYHKPADPEPPTETMNESDALDALGKLSKKLRAG